jgi:hypothetical protein
MDGFSPSQPVDLCSETGDSLVVKLPWLAPGLRPAVLILGTTFLANPGPA